MSDSQLYIVELLSILYFAAFLCKLYLCCTFMCISITFLWW